MKIMTCREFDGLVHGFVRMELLDVTLREAVLDHAAGCANCAARIAEAAILAEASETARRSLTEQQAPARVETALLAAFRRHHRRATWRRTFEWTAIGAAAAVALVFLWTFAGPSKGQPTTSPRRDVSSQSTGPQDAQANPSSQPAELVPGADTEEVDAAIGENLATEDFVPLPFAEAIGPQDLGIVVRVQLTRESLAELGYPLAEAPYPNKDLVSADVLVGEDGWPRAVKVVQ
jgi:hypothetical protein